VSAAIDLGMVFNVASYRRRRDWDLTVLALETRFALALAVSRLTGGCSFAITINGVTAVECLWWGGQP